MRPSAIRAVSLVCGSLGDRASRTASSSAAAGISSYLEVEGSRIDRLAVRFERHGAEQG